MDLTIKLAVAVVAIAGMVGAVIYADHRGYQRCQLEMAAMTARIMEEYNKKITEAEEQRDANQVIIDNLRIESSRVRIHLPACPSSVPQNQNGNSGVLSQRVDQSFANLQERATELFKRCDELNLDAIKLNQINHP